MVKKDYKLREKENDKTKRNAKAWVVHKTSTKISVLVGKIDTFCLVVLPFLFVIFNVAYWSIYLK